MSESTDDRIKIGDLKSTGEPWTADEVFECYADDWLAEILMSGNCFLGYREDGAISIQVNCNDLFYWASADCEELKHADIPAVRAAIKAGGNAMTKWCCQRRGLRPQIPIVERMKKEGEWDADFEALPAPEQGA